MTTLDLRRNGRVAELLLARNSLNTLSPEFVLELTACLRELAQDDGVGSIVLGSTAARFFCAGWDLPLVKELERESMAAFLSAFNRLTVTLATHPKGTVAALSGFAVAGGAILALACDWRVMATGKAKLGLNEVDLGVPMPLPATLLAENVGAGRGARDLLVMGQLFTAEEALTAGLVDAVVPEAGVLDAAREIAARLAAKPPGAVGAMKALLRAPFVRRLELEGVAHEESFLRAWFRPEVRPLLDAAAARLVPR